MFDVFTSTHPDDITMCRTLHAALQTMEALRELGFDAQVRLPDGQVRTYEQTKAFFEG